MPGLPQADIDAVVNGVAWESFRGAKFLITGGTGFVGKWLVEPLIAANQKLGLNIHATLLTRDAARFAKSCPQLASAACIDLVEGDIGSFEFPPGAFTHVIHGATDMAPGQDADAQYNGIVEGTAHVLQFAQAAGAKEFLLVSSGAVYGMQPPEFSPIDETDACAPHTAYGKGKLAAEALMAAAPLACRAARLFAVTGPHLPLNAGYAAGNFVRDALAGKPIEIQGDGTTIRSYLYASDMSVWLWTILGQGKSGAAYNVGSEEPITIADLAQRVTALSGSKAGVAILGQVSGKSPDHYVPSTRKAQSELGLKQTISLDEGLRRMIAFTSTQQRQAA